MVRKCSDRESARVAVFTAELETLDKRKAYLIYCRTGNRSSVSVDIVVKVGFEKIYRIEGDIIAWKSENLPLVK
jgi:rhodanese-related sulfurtransferase